MRKAVYVTTTLIITFLAQSIAVEANPFMFGPHIGITSPQQFKKNIYQTIYQTTSIPIQIQINTPLDSPKIVKVYYILDLNYSKDNNPHKSINYVKPSDLNQFRSWVYFILGNRNVKESI